MLPQRLVYVLLLCSCHAIVRYEASDRDSGRTDLIAEVDTARHDLRSDQNGPDQQVHDSATDLRDAASDTPTCDCRIDGLCYAKKDQHPTDPNAVCDPLFTRFTWSPVPGYVRTFAGAGTIVSEADGFLLDAELAEPIGMFVVGSTILVADYYGFTIRSINGDQVTTLAGCG